MKRIKRMLLFCTIVCITQVYTYAQINPKQQVGFMASTSEWKMQPVPIQTRWAEDVTPLNVLPEYPRPQMVRNEWQNLNGLWQYAITKKNAVQPTQYDGQILVPFPLESALSGVKRPLLPTQRLWYKRSIVKPNIKGGKRVLLHFGAVDWQATVYINNKEVGGHTGGYQNFSFDITDALKNGNNDLIVTVYDPTDQGPNPHGKQVLEPRNIMYTASSGIWQTVWLETVPVAYIRSLYMTPNIDSGHLRLWVNTNENTRDYTIEAIVANGSIIKGPVNTDLLLPIPNMQLWSPDNPYLYNLNVRLLYKGKVIDTVGSYFGMRKIEIKKDEKGIDRIFLNNKYTYNLGVLDQGFWPEGLYTAPTDAALKFDIMAIRNMGFNTIRKHIKLEPARWYYHADKMGILVWQDMVTCADGTTDAQAQFEKENKENMAQLHNYPCIVVWVLFNEGWARYDQQRLTQWMKNEDPSRIVNGHTGENYDQGAPWNLNQKWLGSDLTDIHEYPGPNIAPVLPGKACVLGEWGGIRIPISKHQWNDTEGWGYLQVPAAVFSLKYDSMLQRLKVYEVEGLSASIYTEPFDVETEENGMMTYDRKVIKIPAEKLRKIHSLLLPQSEKYATAGGMFNVQVADTANPDLQYGAMLQQYFQGKKDPQFLRGLSLMATRLNDKSNAGLICNTYIQGMSDPFTYDNLTFIQKFTKTTQDPGFDILLNNPEKVDQVLGPNKAMNKVKSIISNNEIRPLLSSINVIPDWKILEREIVAKYGLAGEEAIWYTKAIHSHNVRDWNSLFASATLLMKKYSVRISSQDLNRFAWDIFENVTDRTMLRAALTWSKNSLQMQANPNYMDTYANLLYKLGYKEEAIKWEKKALHLLPEDITFKDALEKMNNGKKTWN
ncbi:Glycosyl hydrolases family 2, TIM barrel domain [Chitinophaga sp. YR573]|uniref:glycoside hydrolase family 2 protein n=1 Tax=Chitinophaga sp. YR573 TaxID=1881040 RepID=UPI0008B04E86|nr:sugar-binding domain-containing protein [Chitinophaga sp. YR573]SEW03991.1 Glycosyl hydrolases family 2, TIM barrel domain [Chitinophaga sp. YR573]